MGVRADTNCKGQPMVSGEEAFPYAFLSIDQVHGRSTENQRSHFSTTSMISEKRSQCNKRYKLVTRELDQIQNKADTDG